MQAWQTPTHSKRNLTLKHGTLDLTQCLVVAKLSLLTGSDLNHDTTVHLPLDTFVAVTDRKIQVRSKGGGSQAVPAPGSGEESEGVRGA